MPPDPVAPQAPAQTSAPELGTDQHGLRIEPGFVGNAINSTRAVRIQQAMQRAIAETGAVTAEDNAAELAGSIPSTGAPAQEPAATEGETVELASDEVAKPEPARKSKPKAKQPDVEEATATPETQQAGVQELVHERRRLRTSYEAKVRQFEADYQAKVAALNGHTARLQPLADAADAFDSGDLDGFAAAVGKRTGNEAIKDWNSLVNEGLKTAQHGPVYAEMRKLKADQRARDEQARQHAERDQARQQAEQGAAQERQWLANLSSELTGDDDAGVAELTDHDPNFARFAFNAQRAHHQATGEILPTKAAAQKTLADLYQNVQGWNAFFAKHAASPFVQKITGVRATVKKPENGAASRNGEFGTADRNGVRKGSAKAPPVVSQNRTAEASAVGQLSGSELKRRYAGLMNDAAKHDPTLGGTPV